MAERPNATVLKTVSLKRLVGSNPTPSAKHHTPLLVPAKASAKLMATLPGQAQRGGIA